MPSTTDGFDAVADFSGPFPVEVISRMLGVPEPDRQQIRHWLDVMLHREPGQMDPTPEGIRAAMETSPTFWTWSPTSASIPATT